MTPLCSHAYRLKHFYGSCCHVIFVILYPSFVKSLTNCAVLDSQLTVDCSHPGLNQTATMKNLVITNLNSLLAMVIITPKTAKPIRVHNWTERDTVLFEVLFCESLLTTLQHALAIGQIPGSPLAVCAKCRLPCQIKGFSLVERAKRKFCRFVILANDVLSSPTVPIHCKHSASLLKVYKRSEWQELPASIHQPKVFTESECACQRKHSYTKKLSCTGKEPNKNFGAHGSQHQLQQNLLSTIVHISMYIALFNGWISSVYVYSWLDQHHPYSLDLENSIKQKIA